MDNSLIQTLLNHWVAVLVLGCVVAGVVNSLAKEIRKYGCHRQELEFKRDLVERGLSVDEIERLIAAKSKITEKETAG